MEVKDFLVRLCESAHVSGYEGMNEGVSMGAGESMCVGEGTDIVVRAFSEYLQDVAVDKFGNVIGVKKGGGKGKLMLAAHMDEIGLMVADVDSRGFVRFTTLGGFDARVFPALEVVIHGREDVYGVIGVKPPHILPPDEANKAFKAEDLLIDTGYGRDKLLSLIGVGDIITIRSKAAGLKNGCMSVKSLDDSAGVAVLYSAMKRLWRCGHDLDVYFVATVQEEIGARGAATSAWSIAPDIAIAVDVGFGKTPEVDEIDAFELGKGPTIAIGPAIHPAVYEALIKAAKDANLKYQVDVLPKDTGTDTDLMQISGKGVATGVVSIPLKYMHTPVETVKLDDIDQAGRLLAEFVRAFDGVELEGALCL